jgi:N-formylglutamate amidohydrolase
VILGAPHGGTLQVPGVPVRTRGTTVMDANTLELLQAIQQRLQTLNGGRATIVAAKVSRKFVDFNRSAYEAYESATVAPIYLAYHGALRSAVDRIRSSGRALLVGIHGQSADVNVVFRGTRDGQTADLAVLCSSGGFLERLSAGGVALNLTNATDRESPDFNGGTIVVTYGKGATNGLNAVQLEFGYTYRGGSSALNATADKVAAAIAAHSGP